ncbi:ALBINO3-like protein 1, chloroplastic [Seminavis robusta]|uniref:ALBINO3-like protein 1, chloroplastic n=1 Tax=Seminavis robusta TaxID=568900 RepID=A0A9N8I1F2_9STRA|nr:ALBINO3-like protein 1, chloroplastic [Seminavis robusta]|eukprot:Sro3501_g348680.1 ALBINO3-like protein 1, chloroplastic (476) ;mRNA; r:3551-5173
MGALSRRRLFLGLWAPLFLAGSSAAFVPHAQTKKVAKTSNLQVIPGPAEFGDLSSLQHAAHDFFSSTSTLLSDAAAATAEKEPSWWDNYLQVFRNILVTVHDTVDGPLTSAGVENTWGVSIALFTCSMRALLIPLSIQQNKNAEYMKALKPYISEIKEKFKDNEQAKNSATGKLFEDANQNPLAGCAVSILQLPILLGLYRGIRILAQEGRIDEPFLWIPSLEGPVGPPDYRGTEWLTAGWTTDAITGYPVPSMGWETTLAFLAMPLLLVVLQSVTLRVLQPPKDDSMSEEEAKTFEQTQLVFKFLPLMLGFFALQVPAGLTIYWVTTNLFTLTQSLTVRAYFAANPPEINLPDYWDNLGSDKDISDMTPEEKRAAVQAGLSIGPTMEDLKTESKFHTFVDRQPLRSSSDAWQRVVLASTPVASEDGDAPAAVVSEIKIPAEMESWVKGDDQKVLAAAATAEEKVPDAAATTTAA